jgi:hypothetical protein
MCAALVAFLVGLIVCPVSAEPPTVQDRAAIRHTIRRTRMLEDGRPEYQINCSTDEAIDRRCLALAAKHCPFGLRNMYFERYTGIGAQLFTCYRVSDANKSAM